MLSLLLGLAATAADAPSANPGWAVDGSGTRCTLSRSGDAQTLMLRTYPGSGLYDLMLVAPGLAKQFRAPVQPFGLILNPTGTAFRIAGSAVTLQDNLGTAAAFQYLPQDFVAGLAKSATLSLDVGHTEIANFAVPLADKAVAALTYCEHAKLEEWGADPAGSSPGSRLPKPVGNIGAWLTARDLGKAGQNMAGFAVLRLSVASDGSVAGCTPMESNHNAALDAVACSTLTSRARYEPARDATGHAITSVAIYIADWPCPNCPQVDAIYRH